MVHWYVVYTKPKHEDALTRRFSDRGLEVLNPKIKERRFVRRKPQEVIAPLFPCYIFVKLDLFKDHQLVKYTRGVRRLIGSENIPIVVPDELISSIQKRMTEGIIIIQPRKFEIGEEVIVKGGPFQGFEAVFERELKGAERVSVLLKTINAKLTIDSTMIAKR